MGDGDESDEAAATRALATEAIATDSYLEYRGAYSESQVYQSLMILEVGSGRYIQELFILGAWKVPSTKSRFTT